MTLYRVESKIIESIETEGTVVTLRVRGRRHGEMLGEWYQTLIRRASSNEQHW